MKIELMGHTFVFSFYSYRTPDKWTQGSLNRTEDGKYIVYIDYDKMRYEYIEGELKHLQKTYNLSTFFIFQSSEKSYHAICFDKLTAQEYVELLQNSSCDAAFRNIPRFVSYRNWVLRNFEKGNIHAPKLLAMLPSKSKREKSNAHWNYIRTLYSEIRKNRPSGKYDNLKHITLIAYPTAKA